MVLDQTTNFVRVSVSGTHSDTETTISLENGEASKLPDPSTAQYNVVWYDAGGFNRPSDDSNVEIVRVTAVDTNNDTVDVTRGQENTSASTKNTSGGQYVLLLAATSKQFSDVDTELTTHNHSETDYTAVSGIEQDAVGTSEIDLSINPTWTSGHTFPSVTTDDLDIGTADFVSSGDFLPLYTFTGWAQRTESFTATTYTSDNALNSVSVEWDDLFSTDVQTAVSAHTRVVVGTDETVDIRVFNVDDGETIGDNTGITATGMYTIGPVNYTPTTTDGKVFIRLEWKESNGVNSSTIDAPFTSFGIQL